MRIVKEKDGWWITNVPPYVVDGEVFHEMGPYRTRAEAVEDKRGIAKFVSEHPQYAQPDVAGSKTPAEVPLEPAAAPLPTSLPRRPHRRRLRSSPGQLLLPFAANDE